jgi:Complex I intermediate-associated protein 30 (CIA30)
MRRIFGLLAAIIVMAGFAPSAQAGAMIDDFSNNPSQRWRFFADTVMGGVSTGKVEFLREDGASFARMTGTVSTANNGGFIQFRTELPGAAPQGTKGVRLMVRGNGERYYVHLRTTFTILPWQYYQAPFATTNGWREVRLPLEAFKPSGRMLPGTIAPARIKSVGIVAFGRDQQVQVDVREAGFY